MPQSPIHRLYGRWIDDPSLLTLPHAGNELIAELATVGIECLPQLVEALAAGGEQRKKAVAAIEK
eukprot:140506-Chlamydomonas_euryale.AAC.1